MNNLAEHAERVAHIVSEWFSGHPDAPTHTTSSHADTHSPSGAASYAASLASSYWNTYVRGEKGDTSSPPPWSSFFSSSYASSSSFWNRHQWLSDPSAALDSFLWNYTPDLRSLQRRLGLDENTMDVRIVALVMLLPLVLLLLIVVFSMGAGHTDESSHPGLQRNSAGPTLAGGQKKSGKKSSKAGDGSTSSKTKSSQTQHKKSGGAQDNIGPAIPIEGNTLGSWLAHLGSSGFTGAEKLAYKPIDIIAAMKKLEKEADLLEQQHAARRNSWSSMIGAMGFAGVEMDTHEPYKHLKGKHLGHILGDSPTPAHESAAGVPEQRHAKESVIDKAKEGIIGTTAAQHEQDELGLDNQEQEVEGERLQRQEEEQMAARLIAVEEKAMADANTKADVDESKASSMSDTIESTTRPTYASKVKEQMPGAFVAEQDNDAVDYGAQHEIAGTTTNRDKKQASVDSGSTQAKSKVPLRTRTPLPESSKHKSTAAFAKASFGSRLWSYAQSSPFLKNIDAISGGLFGTAVTTVAALANTAEAATTLVKDNVPHKISGLADDLKDSLDFHTKPNDDVSLGAGPYGDSWDIRQALNKINQMHDQLDHRSKGDSSGLSLSVEDISVGPRTSRSLQVPPRVDTGEESELSEGEPELNEALMQGLKEPLHRVTVHPHDEAPGTDLHDGRREQYTIDDQGNKVSDTDARRDSGYDMLV